MKIIYYGSLRYKWLCLKMSLVEKRMHTLWDIKYSLPAYEFGKSNKVLAKIGYLIKRQEDLHAILKKYGTRETRREHNSKLK